MRWKQFFTPVESYDAEKAKEFIAKTPLSDMTILDVRQPKEYEAEHIPGAKLIPVADLGERINEIDREKPTMVYCAIGGRSRVAAQMLSGKGFKRVINLRGGIKAWNGEKAILGEEKGLALFTDKESPEQTLIIAYGLEMGLEDYYTSMSEAAKIEAIRNLFQKLSKVEINHRNRIFREYIRITDEKISQEDFSSGLVTSASEGGMTTEEYIKFFGPEEESAVGIIDMAMSIEAQALDLYFRASERVEHKKSSQFLLQMADEERAHLRQLGQLMDSVIDERN